MAKSTPKISFEQLADLREKSEAVSQFLNERITQNLATLYPILSPRRVFGKYVGAKENVARADEALAQLVQMYKHVSGAPFGLDSELDVNLLSSMENGIDIYPWQYSHEASGKTLAITNPFRWAVSFKSDYSLSELRTVLQQGKAAERSASVGRFVVNALGIQVMLRRTPGVMGILEALGYHIDYEEPQGLGKLPMLTLSTGLTSYRPPDDLMLMATRFSGVPAFIELIDTEAFKVLEDPFRAHVQSLLI